MISDASKSISRRFLRSSQSIPADISFKVSNRPPSKVIGNPNAWSSSSFPNAKSPRRFLATLKSRTCSRCVTRRQQANWYLPTAARKSWHSVRAQQPAFTDMERTSSRPIISNPTGDRSMRALYLSAAVILSGFVPQLTLADDTEWRRYTIPSTGTSVDMPVSVFTSDAGTPEGGGTGRRFFTEDRRADLTVQSVANPKNDSPATFLAKMQPPSGIIYKRVTSGFFVVSS